MRLSLAELVLFAAGAAVVAFLVLQRSGASRSQVVRASWTRTPGVLNPAVTQATIRSTICARGWTSTVRPPVSYTNHLKDVQLAQYGLRGALSAFQEDHLVSLELGGDPTDARNLWPEPYPRAAEVDRIENQLNHEVCTGALSLAEAQRKESALKHERG
ncbi:MAG: hypothetical protein ACXVRE_10430 [Gaiellaceae bacterium]